MDATFGGDYELTLSDGNVLNLTAEGRFCTGVRIGGVRYRKTVHYAAGVNGGAVKNLGLEGIRIELEVQYIGNNEEAVTGNWFVDMLGLAAAVELTLDVFGTDFEGVVVDADSSRLEQPRQAQSGKFEAKGTIVVDAKRIQG